MRFLVLMTLLLGPIAAQDGKGREPRDLETVRYRDFADIVGDIARDVEPSGKAHVIWLVDNASMLKASKHGELLAEAVERSFRSPDVTHSVAVFGETIRVALAVGNAGKAAAAIAAVANGPADDAVKNLLEAVRHAAKLAKGGSKGRHTLVLFTQENADNEDDLEAAVKILKAAGVAFVPIVREAIYSDAYWEKVFAGQIYFPSGGIETYRKLPFKLKGADGPYVEFPWGFPFDWMDPAGSVPSGFAPWAVSRLARETGGKVFLYSVDRSITNFCGRWACPLCSGDHKNCAPEFDVTKLKLTEPFLGSRQESAVRPAKDRLMGAVLTSWERLYREGILEGAPPLRPAGGEAVRAEKDPKPQGLLRSSEWRLQHAQATKFAEAVERAATDVLQAVKRNEKGADRRVLASAETFGVQLKLLAQAFHQLTLFCEGMDKAARTKKAATDGVGTSELEGDGEKVLAWYWRAVPLCHGGASLKDIKFLGDPKNLHAALDAADEAIEKHAGTPWELLLRRSSVPVFLPIFEQKAGVAARGGTTNRPTARSSSTQATTETPGSPQRPSRGGGVDGGSRGSGTTTGGGPK